MKIEKKVDSWQFSSKNPKNALFLAIFPILEKVAHNAGSYPKLPKTGILSFSEQKNVKIPNKPKGFLKLSWQHLLDHIKVKRFWYSKNSIVRQIFMKANSERALKSKSVKTVFLTV